ncbi:hypothetical protein AMJ86_04400 [bacterium SM23_57]|nr:MAG: hypothetical protein AMJ86_04400 [bacterium SM23_57]
MGQRIKKANKWALWLAIIALPIASLGVLRDLTTEDLVTGSEWIIAGRVDAIESRWNDARDYIYTYLTISVDEYWKNPQSPSEIIVQVPGGLVEDIEQKVSDTPEFQVGETVILFLFNQDGQKWVFGWEKGKYTVRDEMVLELGISVSDFKNRVMNIQRQGGSND